MFWIAAALADDRLTLTTGETVTGELIDLRDGRYWVLQPDMQMRSLALLDVVRVERDVTAAAPTAPAGPLPIPAWNEPIVYTAPQKRVAMGFDLGVSQGFRYRARMTGPAVAHIDVTAGLRWGEAWGLAAGPMVSGEVAFFARNPVHLVAGASVGALLVGLAQPYPAVTTGIGLQVDPEGPFELHVSVQAGTFFQGFALLPDLSACWMW